MVGRRKNRRNYSMAKIIQNIPFVEPFTIDKSTSTNLDKKWESYLEEFELFITASGVTENKQKTALLLHLGGKDLREIYKTVKAETDTYNDAKQKLSTYFNPKKNITYERFIFKSASQEVGESCSSYITRLKTLAETCDFEGQVNIEIRDQFIFTCRSTTLKKKLLQQENLTLEKLLEIGRNKELSQKQATEISNTKSSDTTEEEYVNKFNQPRSHSNKQRQTRQSFDRNPEYKTCFKCGGEFTTDHQRSCIAKGKSCYNCGKLNHLSKVCRTKRTDKTVKDRHIRNINERNFSHTLSQNRSISLVTSMQQSRAKNVLLPHPFTS